jgi:hypothetical protein
MREVHKITLTGISDVKRMKVIDVISAALVSQYHKNVMVLQEGHASDAAIDAIPSSITVFIICGESEKTEEKTIIDKQEDKVYKIGDIVKPKASGKFIIDNKSFVNAIVVNTKPLTVAVNETSTDVKFFLANEDEIEFVDISESEYYIYAVSEYQKTKVI